MRSLRRFVLVTLVLRMLLSVAALAQDVPSQKVDQIFSVYDKPGSPGCSLGVIRDDEFVYRKAYGLASLELAVPLSSQSVFYMASVSKQFTAASVVLAAERGYLSLDDDPIGTDDAGNFLFYTAVTVMGLIASPGKS
jgi:CubicO group peptidase (beta-lactamase class C family)